MVYLIDYQLIRKFQKIIILLIHRGLRMQFKANLI